MPELVLTATALCSMLANAATQHAGTKASFDVVGYPPAKNEALSMLGAGHSHAPWVRLFLEAAQRECQKQAFVPVKDWHVAPDVVIRAAAAAVDA